jgi:hypothetical protein
LPTEVISAAFTGIAHANDRATTLAVAILTALFIYISLLARPEKR